MRAARNAIPVVANSGWKGQVVESAGGDDALALHLASHGAAAPSALRRRTVAHDTRTDFGMPHRLGAHSFRPAEHFAQAQQALEQALQAPQRRSHTGSTTGGASLMMHPAPRRRTASASGRASDRDRSARHLGVGAGQIRDAERDPFMLTSTLKPPSSDAAHPTDHRDGSSSRAQHHATSRPAANTSGETSMARPTAVRGETLRAAVSFAQAGPPARASAAAGAALQLHEHLQGRRSQVRVRRASAAVPCRQRTWRRTDTLAQGVC